MRWILALPLLMAGLHMVFLAILAVAQPQTRFYMTIGVQLLGVILLVVLVSIIFTVLFLVLFRVVGQRAISDRFSLFVGWNLIRSHRVRSTPRSALGKLAHGVVAAPRRRLSGVIAVGALSTLGGVALLSPGFYNAAATWVSPTFAAALWFWLLATGLLFVALGLLGHAAHRRDGPYVGEKRSGTWVTLPTFISIVGVSIGVWALIVVLSVMHGFATDLRSKILRTNAHIVVEPGRGQSDIGSGLDLEAAIAGLRGVIEANSFAAGEVMMASSTNVAVNVMVKGMSESALAASEQIAGRVAPGSIRWLFRPEALLSDRFRYPIEGEWLEGLDTAATPDWSKRIARVLPAILLGSELAASLGVDVGSEIQVISPDGDVGPTGLRPKLKAFRVAGIFTTGMYEYDQKMAYMAVSEAQRFFNLGDASNRLEVRLASTDPASTAGALAEVRELAASIAPGVDVSEWQERNKSLFAALQLERLAMFIILGFVILVASLLIVISLVMLIVEKARDIAVLKSLGASGGAVVRTFLVIGGIIGTIGTVSGVTLGVGTCVLIQIFGVPLPKQYYITRLPVALDPIEVTAVGVAALLICLAATLYPSLQASAMRPVDGIRHG